MKSLKIILLLTISLILSLPNFSRAEDVWDILVKEGRKQLDKLETQNLRNEAEGKGHLNKYIIYLNPRDWAAESRWVEDLSDENALSESELDSLNKIILAFNKKFEVRARFYVIYIGGFPVVPRPEINVASINTYEDLKFSVTKDSENTLSYFNHKLGQALTALGSWAMMSKYDERTLYVTGDAIIRYAQEKSERKYFYCARSEGEMLSQASARDKLLRALKYNRDNYPKNASPFDQLKSDISNLSRILTEILRDPQMQTHSLDEIVFGSEMQWDENQRAFTGKVNIVDADVKKASGSPKTSRDQKIEVADYVGLTGSTLQLQTDERTAKYFLSVTQKIKVCLTNNQTDASILNYLKSGGYDNRTELGQFFRLDEGEMMLWVHFEENEHKKVRFWFASTAQKEVYDLLRAQNNRMQNQLMVGGLLEAAANLKNVSDLLSEAIKYAKIPEKYWNPKHPEYPPYMSNLMKALSTSPGNGVSELQLEFALFTGIYNQILNEVAGIPDLLSLLTGYISDEQMRKTIHEGLGSLTFQKVGNALWEGTAKQFNTFAGLDCKSAHLLGKDAIAVLSLFIGLEEIKAVVKSGRFVQSLGDLVVAGGKNYLRLLLEIKKLGLKVVRQGQKLLIYASEKGQELIAVIENGLLKIEKELNDLIDGKILGSYDEVKLVTSDGQTITTKVDLIEKDSRVFMKGNKKGSGGLSKGIDLSKIKASNFEELFSDITNQVTKSGCKSNCTVVAISAAKKMQGKPILDPDKFTEAFVGNGEGGLGILDEYVDLVPDNRNPKKPFINPFFNRMLRPAEAYPGKIDNKVLVQRLFENVPDDTSLIFASYKGRNQSGFTGHAFNVVKDKNGVIKYFDVQLNNRLEYGEGINLLVEKMAKHGLENRVNGEVSSWYFYNASEFKK